MSDFLGQVSSRSVRRKDAIQLEYFRQKFTLRDIETNAEG
jgi:hypothetical protein